MNGASDAIHAARAAIRERVGAAPGDPVNDATARVRVRARVLLGLIVPKYFTHKELADEVTRRTGVKVSARTIGYLVSGEREIGLRIAFALQRTLGIPASWWI
jgi:hypothetical protein